jgi:uncharacterized protein (DUF1684 family)
MGKILINMKQRFFFIILLLTFGCSNSRKDSEEAIAYKKEMEAWHQVRVDILTGPKGWVNVRGLFWLMEGINSFGSGKENDIVFPEGKIADKAGSFILRDSTVSMQVFPDVLVKLNGQTVSSVKIYPADSTGTKTLESRSLQWFVIKRGNKIGIRLRDLESEKLKTFHGIDRFEADLSWKLKAKLIIEPGKTIAMTNVLGQISVEPVKGTLRFSVDGNEYQLEAIDEEGKLFIIFGDATNGVSTYGSGRYLYAAMPEKGDEVILDFNQAINPPCAFTEYATCSLPPRQNILPIKVEAGEKDYHH